MVLTDRSLLPSVWVQRFEPLFCRNARVLDVASGTGRHSSWLASLGHHVCAIDRDAGALAVCGAAEIYCSDLEAQPPPFQDRRFDAVVVTNYLYRPLFPAIAQWLGDDAILLYETFAVGQERFGRPSNPDFLLASGELLQAFGQLQVVAYEQGMESTATPRCVQRICATRRSVLQSVSGFTLPPAGLALSPPQIR